MRTKLTLIAAVVVCATCALTGSVIAEDFWIGVTDGAAIDPAHPSPPITPAASKPLVAIRSGQMPNHGQMLAAGLNPFASVALQQSSATLTDSGEFTIALHAREVGSLSGFDLTLNYDPTRYEFVDARTSVGALIPQNSLQTKANLAFGTVQVQTNRPGFEARGAGALTELTFRARSGVVPAAGDFRFAEGVLIDVNGNSDPVRFIEAAGFDFVPTAYDLKQNLPNPFNPSTSISYQVPEAGNVSIVVYNMLGQVVRRLVDGQTQAGFHTAVWDGRDDLGRRVATGVYVYRMTAPSFNRTLRMMLLK